MTSRLAKLAATALGCAVIAPVVLPAGALAQTTPAPASAPAPAPAAAPTAAPPPADLGFFDRFVKAYTDEMGQAPAPAANAPPGNRAAPYPPQPVTSPPYPFTVWPYGGTNPVGATTPNSIDSPLMTALAPTSFGQFLTENNTQIYGWVNPGFNLSTSGNHKGGNFPAAYAYDPNTLWLDQAVVIFERLPDTVQTDHVDWGFRVSPIYGETYRYTTALGFASYQLQHKNQQAGFDVPMIYGELYIPGIAEGLMIRFGRYISVPDTEAQLAPNNYMYSHSMTYAYDNYTNTGLLFSLQATRNLVVQAGVTIGTDSAVWDVGNLRPSGPPWSNNDPGVQPSFTGCLRYQTDSAYDAAYACANGINNGTWGYNNLQQYALTYYHKFNEKWHITFEGWDMHENHTPNAAAYGEPNQTPGNFGNLGSLLNGPFGAWCRSGASCTSQEYSMLSYLNYQIAPMDNLSWRVEFFNDESGQRTGVKDRYFNYAFGWQHWFSPTIMIRPEVAVYNALDRASFNRNGQGNIGSPASGGPTAMSELVASSDLIWHF
jgi:hypothetical protein